MFVSRQLAFTTYLFVTLNFCSFVFCKETHKNVNLNNQNCGISELDTKSSLKRGDLPWLSIYYWNAADRFACTGHLISSKHVITRAFCITQMKQSPSYDYYAIGQFSSQYNKTATKVVISEIILHPNYQQEYRDNDIAICVLKSTVEVTPICLPKPRDTFMDVFRKKLFAYGWKAEIDGVELWPFGAANFVSMKMGARKNCEELYEKTFQNSTGKFFCATGKEKGRHCDVFYSASGLMYKEDKKWTLRGIMIRGYYKKNKCYADDPFSYVDLAQYMDWIQSVVSK